MGLFFLALFIGLDSENITLVFRKMNYDPFNRSMGDHITAVNIPRYLLADVIYITHIVLHLIRD